MICEQYDNGLTICRPSGEWKVRRTETCPTCDGWTIVATFYDASPWYSPATTCLSCGDSWSDGWLAERPFRPRWRAERIASVLKSLERAAS